MGRSMFGVSHFLSDKSKVRAVNGTKTKASLLSCVKSMASMLIPLFMRTERWGTEKKKQTRKG